MRLIDAERLLADLDAFPYVKHAIDSLIEEQPTVDAIPISFIRDKIEKIKTVISDIHGAKGFEDITRLLIHKAIYLERLIEEWEMENDDGEGAQDSAQGRKG